MAIKKLQNNFTTPEQSKRLLGLGIPEDSADCYFGSYPGHPNWAVIRQSEFDTEDDALFRLNEDIIPCWSVGRLIEIVSICYTGTKFYYSPKSSHKVEFWLERIENWSKIGFMDFLKLDTRRRNKASKF